MAGVITDVCFRNSMIYLNSSNLLNPQILGVFKKDALSINQDQIMFKTFYKTLKNING